MDNFLIVAQQVAILFVLIGAGALMRRAKLFGDVAIGGIVNILVLVVAPCLIVDVFQRPFDSSELSALGWSFVLSALAHVAVIALAVLCVRHRDGNVRRPLLLAAVFSNAGFMGIPLEKAVLGDGGVFFGVVYAAVFNLFIWSWGLVIMKNEECRVKNGRIPHSSFFTLHSIVNPGTIGLALGLLVFFFSIRLPAVIGVPVHEIANLNTPLAMFVIGHYLAGAKLGRVAKMGAAYVTMAIRLVGCPLLMIAALYPFRHALDRDMMLAIVIAACAPVAAMVSMFASKYGRDIDASVAVVSASTLISILTMPPVIAFAMSVL